VADDLSLGHHHVDAGTREGADLRADALLKTFVAEVCAPLPGDDRETRGVVACCEAHRAVAHEHERPEVALLEAVDADGLEACLDQLVDGPLFDGDRHDVCRHEQAADVLAKPKNGAPAVILRVAANALERAQSVMKRMGEDVDVRLVPIHELSVEPDLLHLVDHAASMLGERHS
jgi:hypothetical protein